MDDLGKSMFTAKSTSRRYLAFSVVIVQFRSCMSYNMNDEEWARENADWIGGNTKRHPMHKAKEGERE